MDSYLNCDLHMHSLMSDGTDSPKVLAKRCYDVGIRFAALADHDTAAGAQEFSCEGLRTLTGIEWNVDYEGEELHILGYGFDPKHPALVEVMDEMVQNRIERTVGVVKMLCEAGYEISLQEVETQAKGVVIGRPHIASVLVNKGYAGDSRDAFERFLIKGKAGFYPRKKISPSRAMDVTIQAGGVCVMAHPGITADPELPSLLARLKDEGLSGLEIYYPTHTDEEIAYYEGLSHELSLFATRGSDYHGAMRSGATLGMEKRGSDLLEKGVERLLAL